MSDTQPIVSLGGIPITSPDATDMRLAMLIWGDLGCGKTTLASTAPGNKLYIMFDPDGSLSLANRADVSVMDLGGANYRTVMAMFRSDDPYTLTRFLTSRPDIQTVVVDSVTTLAYMALQEAVSAPQNKNSTMESPGINGFSWRNATVLRVCTVLTTITKQLKRNIIFLAHEQAPDRDAQGHVLSITMMLSENTAKQVGLRLNEVWWMNDSNGVREISVRPCQMRKPMKTRLFVSDKTTFTWHFDPATMTGEGIADWFAAWQSNNGNKIALPSVKTTTQTKGGQLITKNR
jgi:hypothetical protein